MLRWDQNFYQPVLGNNPDELMARFNTPNSDHQASDALYANGQFVGTRQGVEAFWHSGGWLGTSTYYGRFPERRTSLIVMCNNASLDTTPLIKQAQEIILGEARED